MGPINADAEEGGGRQRPRTRSSRCCAAHPVPTRGLPSALVSSPQLLFWAAFASRISMTSLNSYVHARTWETVREHRRSLESAVSVSVSRQARDRHIVAHCGVQPHGTALLWLQNDTSLATITGFNGCTCGHYGLLDGALIRRVHSP